MIDARSRLRSAVAVATTATLVVLVVAVLLAVAALVVVSGPAGTADATNETIRHEDPDEYDDEGDLGELEGWLAERLTERLEGGAVELGEGEYELAGEYVDEEYQEQLDRYVEVTAETSGDGEAETFEEAGERQAELAENVAVYEETRAEYEDAVEDGDDERARELARELETLEEEIESSGETLDESYDRIEDETDADVSDGRTAIETTRSTVSEDQEAIRDAAFTETELTLEPDGENASFVEPLNVTGELETANGTAIPNESGTLTIGNDTETFETDGNGTFELAYRPTDAPTTGDELPVAYEPEDDSPFLGTETTLEVSIEQVEPTVSDLETPDAVAYDDEVTVRGELLVADEPVDDVPLTVTLADEEIGNTTVSNGSFEGTAAVPSSVPVGEAELGVELAFDDRALTSVESAETVTVTETETVLSTDAAPVDDAIYVTGEFATDGGEPIGNETVDLRVDDESTGAVETGSDGEFNATIAAPSDAAGETSVVATYDGAESNFAGTDAETTIELGASGPATTVTTPPVPAWAPYALGVVLVGGIVVAVYRSRRSSSPSATSDDELESVESEPAGPSASATLLSRASEELANGRTETAVRTSYAAVRRALGADIDDRALTHWEFYRLYRSQYGDRLDPTEDGQLRDVIEGFERARFGGTAVSVDEAERILDRAMDLCDTEPATRPATTVED